MNKTPFYSGKSQFINKTLRIVLEHLPNYEGESNSSKWEGDEKKRQFSEIKLICNERDRDAYVGLQSDTDLTGLPDCYACIAINYEKLKEFSNKFESDIIDFNPDSAELKKAGKLLIDNYDRDFYNAFNRHLDKKNPMQDFFNTTGGGLTFHNYHSR